MDWLVEYFWINSVRRGNQMFELDSLSSLIMGGYFGVLRSELKRGFS